MHLNTARMADTPIHVSRRIRAPASATRVFSTRKLNALLNVSMLLMVAATFATGVLALVLGADGFPYHRYAAIGMLALVLLHIGRHWGALAAQLSRLGSRS